MLANGAKLGYKKKSEASSAYKDLPGLKEIPELGSEPEKVENTTLTDPNKMYELGIGDLPDMVYKYKYITLRRTARIVLCVKRQRTKKY